MFLLPFKGREQRDLSVSGQAAGKGTAAVRAADPPSLHPCKHPSAQPPSPPTPSLDFPSLPQSPAGPSPLPPAAPGKRESVRGWRLGGEGHEERKPRSTWLWWWWWWQLGLEMEVACWCALVFSAVCSAVTCRWLQPSGDSSALRSHSFIHSL